MSVYLIEMFSVSLLLTLVLELIVAGMFRVTWGKGLLPVILVNVLTNPTVVFLCWVWRLYLPTVNIYWLQIPLEGFVVWVEYILYKSLVKSGWQCEKPFGLSLTANGASWLVGVIVSLVR